MQKIVGIRRHAQQDVIIILPNAHKQSQTSRLQYPNAVKEKQILYGNKMNTFRSFLYFKYIVNTSIHSYSKWRELYEMVKENIMTFSSYIKEFSVFPSENLWFYFTIPFKFP